jgi:hypothetical protein
VSDECEDCRYRTIGWKLDEATPEQLAIIEAVLAGDDWDKVMRLVNRYWMKHFMPRPKVPSVISMLEERQVCPTCGGSGEVTGEALIKNNSNLDGVCPTCHGKGEA